MTTDEYALWVGQPSALRFIVAAHRRGLRVDALLTSNAEFGLAARAENADEAQQVVQWLVESGRIDPDEAATI